MSAEYHLPVLAKEVVELLNLKDGGTYVDCTLGGGGHALNFKLQNPNLKIIGIDQDAEAIGAAKTTLAQYSEIEYIQDNFKNLNKIVKEPVDGILFDLGVSSHQINAAERGFSLQHDGPLDMRMDKMQKLSAAEIINEYRQEELVKIFREFGEERFAPLIARAIIKKRTLEPIANTAQLKTIVEKAIPTWRKRESVTRIFQSLRIAVNEELDVLNTALLAAIALLKPGGRIVVISYHSLEDRIVKHTLRQSGLEVLTKKPLLAGAEELAANPRARSAKLRGAAKR